MLGKLLKYEIKATGRTFMPLYGAILILALINRLTGLFGEIGFFKHFTGFILVSLFISLAVMTMVVMVQRFNKNLLGDEGYLMFTLPVKTHSLINSKLIATGIWSIVSCVIALLAFMILFVEKGFWGEFTRGFVSLLEELKSQDIQQIVTVSIEVIVLGVLEYVGAVLTVYVALAATQIAKFNKWRMPAAFVTFFVINIVISWVSYYLISAVTRVITFEAQPVTFLGLAIIWSGLIAGVLFAATNYILKRHLNLN